VITKLPARGTVLIVVAFVLASLLLTLYVWRSVGGAVPLQPKRYSVTALFDNASQLTKEADIRISGVNVGSVTNVVPRGLLTEATLSLDSRFAPLPSDVRAIIRQKTLLGESFVELSPGSRTAPKLREGARLAMEQVAPTQPLDRVLGMLDKPTRERLHELLTNTGTMLEGRGTDLNAAFGNFALGARQLRSLVAILDSQRPAVESLVRDGGRVFQTVGDHEADVQRLVRSAHAALSATAERDKQLTATVRAAPGLLRELRVTANAASRTATLAAPVLDEFRPVAPLLAPVMRSTREITPEIRRLLVDLEGLMPTARRALPAAGAVVSALSPLVDVLEPAAAEVVPMIDYMATYRKELVATMANVGASTLGKSPSTNGRMTRYLRTIIPIGQESIVGWTDRIGENRYNAYRAPGELIQLAEGMASAGCAHATSGGNAPPCRVATGWSFKGGPKAFYQHISPAKP
jgi:virulence factor Mce-like protein